jgi:hypothetical protein
MLTCVFVRTEFVWLQTAGVWEADYQDYFRSVGLVPEGVWCFGILGIRQCLRGEARYNSQMGGSGVDAVLLPHEDQMSHVGIVGSVWYLSQVLASTSKSLTSTSQALRSISKALTKH